MKLSFFLVISSVILLAECWRIKKYKLYHNEIGYFNTGIEWNKGMSKLAKKVADSIMVTVQADKLTCDQAASKLMVGCTCADKQGKNSNSKRWYNTVLVKTSVKNLEKVTISITINEP